MAEKNTVTMTVFEFLTTFFSVKKKPTPLCLEIGTLLLFFTHSIGMCVQGAGVRFDP